MSCLGWGICYPGTRRGIIDGLWAESPGGTLCCVVQCAIMASSVRDRPTVGLEIRLSNNLSGARSKEPER